jgi:NADH-quinone oxidoreductase subunit H
VIEILFLAGRAITAWAFVLSLLPLLIWFERKGSAFIQDRTGPNRAAILGVRLGGIVHNAADVLKLITKEEIVPIGVNRAFYTAAPIVGMTVSLLTIAVVPLADTVVIGARAIPLQVTTLNAGILYLLAISSFSVYSIILAGWASNNKFAFLGGLRAAAQMISYELTLGLSIVGVLMVFGSLDLNEIARAQGERLFGVLPRWGVFVQPVGFLLFLTAAFAETNRNPFDLPEGESEIIGYHVEYSSMRFALFFMAEYANMIVSAAMITTLFFGGWQVPYLATGDLIARADMLVPIALALVAGGAAGGIALSLRYRRALRRLYADARAREADVYAAACALAALAALAGLAVARDLPPWAPPVFAAAAQFGAFVAKVLFFTFLFVWVRWTLPRFRYDQLMRLGWKGMIPLALANIVVTAVALAVGGGRP